MISTSKLAEQVFNNLCAKILGTKQQLENLLVHQFFDKFQSKHSFSSNIIRNLQDETQTSQKEATQQLKLNTKRQTLAEEQRKIQDMIKVSKQSKNLSIHMRIMCFNSFRSQSKQIEEFKYNFSHNDLKGKVNKVLFNYFCHYSNIFEELQLQSQAYRIEKDCLNFFVSNTVQLFTSIFSKGFRSVPTLFKCLIKTMFLAGYFSNQVYSRIKKEINSKMPVPIDLILPEHNYLAYQSAYILRGANIPINLEDIIEQAEEERRKKKKEQKMLNKKLKRSLKKVLINGATSLGKLEHKSPGKRVKLEQSSPKKSYVEDIILEKPQNQHALTLKLPVNSYKIDTKQQGSPLQSISMRNETNISKPASIKSESFAHSTPAASNFVKKQIKQQQRPFVSKVLPFPQDNKNQVQRVSKRQNLKAQHHGIMGTKIQRLGSASASALLNTNQGTRVKKYQSSIRNRLGYRVIQTILLDESDQQCKKKNDNMPLPHAISQKGSLKSQLADVKKGPAKQEYGEKKDSHTLTLTNASTTGTNSKTSTAPTLKTPNLTRPGMNTCNNPSPSTNNTNANPSLANPGHSPHQLSNLSMKVDQKLMKNLMNKINLSKLKSLNLSHNSTKLNPNNVTNNIKSLNNLTNPNKMNPS